MENFYLNYKKGKGKSVYVETNIPDSMLKSKSDYDEEWMFTALSASLQEINALGDEAKELYKKLCEENGALLYNAAMVYYGINQIDENAKHYDKYYEFFKIISQKINDNAYTKEDIRPDAKLIKFKLIY